MSKPVFEDLFTFSGRRNRLSYFLASLALVTAIFAVATIGGSIMVSSNGEAAGFILILTGLIPLVLINLAVTAQRIRDFGWTGWAVLISIIPYIGFVFMIAILFIPGTQGPNRYGPDPLGGEALPDRGTPAG